MSPEVHMFLKVKVHVFPLCKASTPPSKGPCVPCLIVTYGSDLYVWMCIACGGPHLKNGDLVPEENPGRKKRLRENTQ